MEVLSCRFGTKTAQPAYTRQESYERHPGKESGREVLLHFERFSASQVRKDRVAAPSVRAGILLVLSRLSAAGAPLLSRPCGPEIRRSRSPPTDGLLNISPLTWGQNEPVPSATPETDRYDVLSTAFSHGESRK
jgi:hypothetical protein